MFGSSVERGASGDLPHCCRLCMQVMHSTYLCILRALERGELQTRSGHDSCQVPASADARGVR